VEKRVRSMRATPTRGGGNAEGNAVSKILSGEHLTLSKIYLEDTRGELGYT
jgi:hypothetical protein